MINNKFITVEIDANEITLPEYVRKVNIGSLISQNNFSIVTHTNDEKLKMIVDELINDKNILIGYACYNIQDIRTINRYLSNYKCSLNTVYIPSFERIEQRKREAMKNVQLHGRWIGSTEEEVEQNFKVLRTTLRDIKDGLINTEIKVLEI